MGGNKVKKNRKFKSTNKKEVKIVQVSSIDFFFICAHLGNEEEEEMKSELLENKLKENIKKLSSLKNYDYEKFLYSMIHLTSQLNYFYENLAGNGPTDDVFYSRDTKNLEHKLIYINLGRGFPKEIMDGHWCYVLKDYRCKILVIPTTSIKKDSKFDYEYDLDIVSKDIEERKVIKSRLCITEIRTVDIQRIDKRKKFKDVLTSRVEIVRFVKKRIF